MDIFNTTGDLLFSHVLSVAYHLTLAGAGLSAVLALVGRRLGRRTVA